jgi:two-component system, chemotaxis family, protein-glutamate methylesterase/glutaminase
VSAAYEIVIIGTSWGGLDAFGELVCRLPRTFGLAIVFVQHRHRDSSEALAAVLRDRTALEVTDIEDKQPATPGCVFVAPPDYHTLVEEGFFSLSTEAPVRYSRPSIDVTFNSAADSYAERAVGIVLTGSNADGAQGLRRIAQRGGMAIVQDPATAESPMMPAAALAAVPAAKKMTLREISEFLAILPTLRPQDRRTAEHPATTPETRSTAP